MELDNKRLIKLDGVEVEIVSVGKTEVCYTRPDKPMQAFIIECSPTQMVSVDEDGNEVVTYEISDEQIIEAYNTPKEAKETPIKQKLYAEWMQIPAEVRGPFMPYWSAINSALDLGDYDGAVAAIKAAPVPPELEPMREQFLAMLTS